MQPHGLMMAVLLLTPHRTYSARWVCAHDAFYDFVAAAELLAVFHSCTDPYCNIQCAAGLTVREKWRSKTHNNGGKTPSWNEKKTFNVVEGDDRLMLQCYDDDAGKDDLVGSVAIDLNQLYQRGTRDEWFSLQTTNGRPAGEIRLVLQFQPQGGVPAGAPGAYGAPPPQAAYGAPPPGYAAPPPGYGAPPPPQPGYGGKQL